ncbi:hypothetical protein [Bacillus sp. 005/A4HT-01/001]|uniref:hypothetical protein n=1 Tax=Bacillus sp. 005/A4HT-01/001 TaxID=2509010 RepID=UPI001074A9C3|nr:hypothetical protein [Bacillus sp. 005/A4HT-01/001]TFW49265.1 hypothetical protein ES896_02275 [Bacillus sp. 005/A4HT-01/001]
MTKYKTEKRKARVGERILITNVDVNEKRYENGAVLDVVDSQGRIVHDKEGRLIYDHEYEVIVGEHTPTPNLYEMSYDELAALVEDAMKALRTRSYKNGYDQGRFDAEIESAHGTYEKSDQQKRDEIVAKAKEDVETLKMRNRLSKAFTIQVIERPKSRTVEATAKVPNSRKAFYGIAKCAPTDCFNAHIGKAIALRRALGLEVPSEYLNVPQPTEVRVGDVVRGIYTGGNETYEETLRKIEGGRYTYDSGGFDYIEETDLVIIDDSRTEVNG